MAGLVPAIHVFLASWLKDVDARHKAGHDELRSCRKQHVHRASDATPAISISIFGSGSACTTQVVRAG
jgi:hypothetical protein